MKEGFVIEDGFELLIEGEPPRVLRAGESYKISAHTIHDAKTGADGAKAIATYVVERNGTAARIFRQVRLCEGTRRQQAGAEWNGSLQHCSPANFPRN
ncbi:hypothetical protein JJB98_18855 [Bradyrhizobium diazoefficiens]|nr:hypothetical protein [Bradyrhizobium diazoefficiens]QQO21847.1 hypothetical protein JJB98_18855 [Bradyrhizobium diazoefficiens]